MYCVFLAFDSSFFPFLLSMFFLIYFHVVVFLFMLSDFPDFFILYDCHNSFIFLYLNSTAGPEFKEIRIFPWLFFIKNLKFDVFGKSECVLIFARGIVRTKTLNLSFLLQNTCGKNRISFNSRPALRFNKFPQK